MKSMKSKQIHKVLHKVVKKLSKCHFDESWTLLDSLDSLALSDKEQRNLHKVLNLLIVAELFDLHNLGQIADYFGISGRNLYRTWRKFSNQKIMDMVNEIFWISFRHRMIELCQKSDATWSRNQVTLVVDSSIYKHYISNPDTETEKIRDKFFSGQYKSTVYGFRLTLIGVVIDAVFYPINFYVSSKEHKEVTVAKVLVKRVGKRLKQLKNQDAICFPNLFMSVDNGFCETSFFETNQDIGIDPISVPTKSWIFEIDGEKGNLTEYINTLKAREEAGEVDIFPYRKKAFRKGFGDVVLLFFRLKKGIRINVIMTTRLDIKAKTLRRRWFQRTYIEQFFRFSKHTLRIQETKAENVNEFVRKLALNFLKVMVCQTFTQICRKKEKLLKKWSFHKIRDQISYHKIHPEFLEKIVTNYDDLLHSRNLVTNTYNIS